MNFLFFSIFILNLLIILEQEDLQFEVLKVKLIDLIFLLARKLSLFPTPFYQDKQTISKNVNVNVRAVLYILQTLGAEFFLSQ